VAVPPAVVTFTETVPAAWAGSFTLIFVGSITRTVVAGVVPNFTELAPVKLEPPISTVVPPAVVPEVGVSPVIVGVGATNL
jgi:hypothetical protein